MCLFGNMKAEMVSEFIGVVLTHTFVAVSAPARCLLRRVARRGTAAPFPPIETELRIPGKPTRLR